MKIWFVVGVSGAGKSHFSEYAAGHLGFFHYEIDQTPHDGITHFGLRSQWNTFIDEIESGPLVKELTKRSCVSGCPGAILSFPSNLLTALGREHVEALQGKVNLVVLTGDPEFCKREFLKRERQTGRNYSASVWGRITAVSTTSCGRIGSRRTWSPFSIAPASGNPSTSW